MSPPAPPSQPRNQARAASHRPLNPAQQQNNGGPGKQQRRHTTYKAAPPAPPAPPAQFQFTRQNTETLMVPTKQDGDRRGRSPTKRSGDLDRSDRSARSDGFMSVSVKSNGKARPQRRAGMRKRCNSADNLGAMIDSMDKMRSRNSFVIERQKPRHSMCSMVDLPLLPKENQSKPKQRKSNPNIAGSGNVNGNDPNLYDRVLMDLFSSVGAGGESLEYMNMPVPVPPSNKKIGLKNSRSTDGLDSMEPPSRNSFVDGAPRASRPRRATNATEGLGQGAPPPTTHPERDAAGPTVPPTSKQGDPNTPGGGGGDAKAPLRSGNGAGATGGMPRNNSDMMLYQPIPRRKSIDAEKTPGLNKANGEGPKAANPTQVNSANHNAHNLSANQTSQKQLNASPKTANQTDPQGDNSNSNNNNKKSNRLNNDQNKLKLYDEILSASDPKIGRTIVWPSNNNLEGTNSTEPDPSYLLGSMKGANEKGGSFDADRKTGRCRPYRRFIVGGLFLVLAGLGAGAYFFFFRGEEEEEDAEESQVEKSGSAADGTKESNENSTKLNMTFDSPSAPPTSNGTAIVPPPGTAIVPPPGTAIVPPPADIEARCSASNLPGSLSVCLAACLPSACCYPGFDTCLDNAGCPAYRPYCDVFYDAWIGSTEGVLRGVSDEVLVTCSAGAEASLSYPNAALANSSSTPNSTSFQIPPLPEDVNSTSFQVPPLPDSSPTANASPDSSTTVKRLRGHVIQDPAGDIDDSRKLQSSQETCQHYCTAAKCCSATIVTDPQAFGLVLSPTGVYTNAFGEHVVTNCQVSNSQNVGLCAKYQTFCPTDAVVGDSLSSTPGSSLALVMPSGKPVELPSGTTPSLPQSDDVAGPSVPEPDASNDGSVAISLTVPNQSTDAGNSSLIVLDSSNATAEETFTSGQSSVSSPTPSPSTPSPSITPGTMSSSISGPTSISIPSAPAQEIQDACASDRATFLIATGDASARTKCIQACQDGLCCFTSQLGYEWMESCQAGNQLLCTEYSPCLILAQGTVSQGGAGADPAETTLPDSNPAESVANSTLSVDNTDVSGIESSSLSNETTTYIPDAAAAAATEDNAASNESPFNIPEIPTGTVDTAIFNETTVNIPDVSTVDTTPETANIPDMSTVENPSANTSDAAQVDGPPVPDQDLNVLCSMESISQPAGLEACIKSCQLGRCCGADDETGCFSTHSETCYLYFPCNNAYDLLYG